MRKNTILKTILLAIAIITGSANAWAAYSGTGTFTKISSLADLTDGNYIIAYGTTFAMNNTMTTFFGNNAITPTEGTTIINPSAAIVWQIKTEAGGKTIYNEATAKYVSYTGSSNSAQAVDAVSTNNQLWTIALPATEFTITNVALDTRLLQYNVSSPRFACYTGSQKNITLYKMVVSNTAPTLSVTPETLNAFTYIYGSATPSAEQSFTVSGSNLTNDVIITAPTDYEISTTTGDAFVATNPITLTMADGFLSNTTIYTRLKAGLTAADYNQSISISSINATSILVACVGSVACLPSGLSFENNIVNRSIDNASFTQLATSLSAAAITYSSSATAQATVNANTGEVTLISAGATVITASQAASAEYCANTATYTLNITLAEPTIVVTEISIPEMVAEVGSTDAETITIAGLNLTADISLAITGTNANQFSLSETSIVQTNGIAPNTQLTITYRPTEQATHTATLMLSSPEVTTVAYTLNASATWPPLSVPVATVATNISANGFTANWEAVAGATSYDLNVYTTTVEKGLASDLIISEYVEGSSNNKAIEIYNGTGAAVDLSSYSIKKQSNGAGEYAAEQILSGTLANDDVYIMANTQANADILAMADINNETTATFNGNDAVALFKSGVKIDEVGILNQVADWGKDKTLLRNSSILSPKATYEVAEWEAQATDYITNLGMHTLNVSAPINTSVSGYPMLGITDHFKAVTGLTAGTNYYYIVVAKNANVSSTASSVLSVATSDATGLSQPTTALTVKYSNGKIMLNAAAGETVNIFNAIGQQLESKVTVEGWNTITVAARGVVIVKVGNRVAKVIM